MGTSRTPPKFSGLPADVLVVEDNFIIALDTQEMLFQLGVEVVRCATSVKEALMLIGQAVPHFALLDVNLGAEKCFAVAERLQELAVPFAFATGYGDNDSFPPQFSGTPIVSKPYNIDTLRAALWIA